MLYALMFYFWYLKKLVGVALNQLCIHQTVFWDIGVHVLTTIITMISCTGGISGKLNGLKDVIDLLLVTARGGTIIIHLLKTRPTGHYNSRQKLYLQNFYLKISQLSASSHLGFLQDR